MSFYDFVTSIFDELNVLPLFRTDLMDTVQKVAGSETFDYTNVREIIDFNYQKMLGQ